jgi:hypothetical protein
MTRSNTHSWCYRVRQTPSHWKNRQKVHRRQKPNHAMPWAPPKWLFSRSCFLTSVVDCDISFKCLDLQSAGHLMVIQSCCIVITIDNIGILWKQCIEGTAPISREIFDSCLHPVGPNEGLCCECRCDVEIGITCCTVVQLNWKRFYMAM